MKILIGIFGTHYNQFTFMLFNYIAPYIQTKYL